jgi:ATP adenylyltransferase
MMAVPYRKVPDIAGLSAAERMELWELTEIGERLLRRVVNAQGFNVGFNLGKCAGAGVEDHLHLHIVPRWEADTNFMPVLSGGVRVMAEALVETYRKLHAALEEIRGQGATGA